MTIIERMKMVREEAGDNFTQCGEKIGISRSAVSMIESGKNRPSNQTIELFCREYGINREWLETGNGDMKKPPLDEVAEILSDILDKGKDDIFYGLILAAAKAYQSLSDNDRKFMQGYLETMIKIQHESFSKDTEE